MCDLQWDALAEICLKKEDWPQEIRCLCSRLFTKGKRKRNAAEQTGALEDDTENGDESNTCEVEITTEKSLCTKVECEQETASCYCSASHTDTLSTDEHDSLRDTHETSLIKQSDSGADLSEHSKHDIEADWHKYWSQNGEKLIWESWIDKYSAYINPEYLPVPSTTSEEKSPAQGSDEKLKQTIENTALKNQVINSVLIKKARSYKESVDSNKSLYTNSESETVKSLGQLNLNSSNEEALVTDDSEDYEINEDLNAEMMAMGLPLSFASSSEPKTEASTKKIIISKSDSFNAGRNRVRAAFNLVGMEFREEGEPVTGRVDFKMKHIRLQNRHLQIYAKPRKHTFFDDDGNVVAVETTTEEEQFCPKESEDSEDYLSIEEDEVVPIEEALAVAEDTVDGQPVTKRKRKKKRKINLPPEIKENAKLRKYWQKRFTLFSRFDQGIRLDEESWYSVTPEQIAKFTAEKCKCSVIVDAFCGAGGNSIQFATVCDRVISFDIDPHKIELAKHNAAIYGVADKIEFIVGDFFKMAPTLKADVVFASPPWGGPAYINEPVYDVETMLQPLPLSHLLAVVRTITPNVAVFLPKNSNTFQLIKEAGPGGTVEIQQEFLNNQLIAITVYYGNLVKVNQ